MHLKSQQEVKTHYTNQAIKEALGVLKENKYKLSFEQVREVRDLLDEAVLGIYNSHYDGTNGNGYQPVPGLERNPKPPTKR